MNHGLLGLELTLEGGNSFFFEVIRAKFCTELLWDKINLLHQRNQDQMDNDVTVTLSLL